MKTLTLILLFVGTTLGVQSYAFSLFNLPENTINVNPVDNLSTVVATPIVSSPVADNTRVHHDNFTDTIIIDLDEVVVESSFPNAAHKCIIEQVPYPSFAQEKGIEGAVVVKFSFDESGRARVEDAMSNDPRLAGYVQQKIENLQLRNCIVQMHKPYYMRFLFKLY